MFEGSAKSELYDISKRYFFKWMFIQSQSRIQGGKDLDVLANNRYDIPGEAGFPLNAIYAKPGNKKEEGSLS